MRQFPFVSYLIMFVFLAASMSAPAWSAESNSQDVQAYINYLKSNKAQLQYNTYGVIELETEVMVKIYCEQSASQAILDSLNRFEVIRYQLDEPTPGQIVVSAVFSKEAPAAASSPGDEQPVAVPGAEETDAQQAETDRDCPRRVEVRVKPVESRDFIQYRAFKAAFLPAMKHELASPLSTTVGEVMVNKGDVVTAGETLLVLNTANLEQEIEQTEALLAQWKDILWKRQHWAERSPRAEQQAQKQVDDAAALLEEKKDLLARCTIKASASGRVHDVVSVDDAVEAGAPVARIVSDQRLKVVVPAQYAGLFDSGQVITLTVVETGSQVSGRVEKDDGVEIVVDNTSGRLNGGEKVRFRVVSDRYEDATVVPESALQTDAKGAFLFVVAGKKAGERRVDAGATEAGVTHIRSGVTPGEEVIVSGIECLEDGKRIRIMAKDPESGEWVPRKKIRAKKPRKERGEKEVSETRKPPVKEGPPARSYFSIAGGVTAYLVFDEVFTDVYGSLAPGGFVNLSYTIKDKFAIFLSAAYLTVGGEFSAGLGDPTTLNMVPFYLGVKYQLKGKNKWRPFIGAAVIRNNAKESVPEDDPYHTSSNYKSDFGGSVLGGATYYLKPGLHIIGELRFDILESPVEAIDDKIIYTGPRILIGIQYTFGSK